MVVYLEYALAENFLIDGLLLFLTRACTRSKVRLWRVFLAAALGAVQAVVFPLLRLSVWASYTVKILFGVALCLIISPKGIKQIVLTCAAFFALTFAYGGLLTAAYSFFNVQVVEGNGYLVEQAPVSLVTCAALAFAVAVFLGARGFYRYAKVKRNLTACTLCAGERTLSLTGFCDSGNLLTFHDRPVCVVSAVTVFALFGRGVQSAGRIRISTVNGSRDAPVFACDGLRALGREWSGVYLTVGEVPKKQYQIILHSSLTGEQHEANQSVAGMAEKNGG